MGHLPCEYRLYQPFDITKETEVARVVARAAAFGNRNQGISRSARGFSLDQPGRVDLLLTRVLRFRVRLGKIRVITPSASRPRSRWHKLAVERAALRWPLWRRRAHIKSSSIAPLAQRFVWAKSSLCRSSHPPGLDGSMHSRSQASRIRPINSKQLTGIAIGPGA